MAWHGMALQTCHAPGATLQQREVRMVRERVLLKLTQQHHIPIVGNECAINGSQNQGGTEGFGMTHTYIGSGFRFRNLPLILGQFI